MKHWLGLFLIALVLSGGSAMAVEEPSHTVVLKDGAVEVRDYPALVAAEVSVSGDRDQASSAGFRLLAGYIFGGNTRKQSIAMTAPVVQASSEKIAMTAPVIQSGDARSWTVRFIMPEQYTLETLPTPNDARVRLVPVAPARMAVVRFSGLAGAGDVARRTAELEAFMARRSLRPAGPPSLARYDPPWTLWFLRRNEVFIPVERTAS
jgi:SOUL heme-binding protein